MQLAETWNRFRSTPRLPLKHPEILDSLFWLVVLTGATPALMSNLISPLEWPGIVTAPQPFVFPPVEDMIRLGALVLAALGGAIALQLKRRRHLLLILPLVLYAVLSNDPGGSAYFATHAAYNLAAFLVVLGFVLSGHSRLRSLYFIAYLVLLIAISFVDPLIWIYQIVLFLSVVVVARIVTLFIRENTTLFRQLGWARTLHAAGTALLMWLPILVFLVPGQWLNATLGGLTEDYLYTIEPLSFLENARDPTTGKVPKPRDLRNDLIVAFDLATDFHESEIDQQLSELGSFTDETMAQMPDRGTEIVRAMLPADPLLAMPHCHGWWDILCQIEAAIKGGINKGYSRMRDHQLANVHAELTAIANDRNRDAQSKIAEAKSRLGGVMARVNSAMKTSVVFAARSIDAFNVVFNLVLALAAIKSYLHVFARFAFAPGSNATVSLRDPEARNGRKGTITKYQQVYRIAGTNRTTYYYARHLVAEGRAGDFTIPQWHSAVLPRLASFKYAMNRARFGGRGAANGLNNTGAVVFKVTEPSELVEWQLAAGEQVIFDMNDFAAMTEDLTLGTIVSFRLSTLLIGRIVYQCATGPGVLLLRCHGEPTITGNRDVRLNRPVDLLVAWDRRASFEVHAARDLINIYMSGVNLASTPGDRVVVERGVDRKSVSTGIVRFIRSFLLPF